MKTILIFINGSWKKVKLSQIQLAIPVNNVMHVAVDGNWHECNKTFKQFIELSQ